MKQLISFMVLSCFMISARLQGQTTFWTEDFSNGCTSLCTTYTGTNGVWTVSSTGANGSAANAWYFSCAENGNAAGACGSNCGSDQSLHVGNVSASSAASFFCPGGDCGAAYDDSGPSEITNKRIESPVIDCSGRSNITLSFNYIEQGNAPDDLLDDCGLWYFDGSLWMLLDALPSTTNGSCGTVWLGKWTTFSITLPASANGNSNVKIGFNWTNNGDGIATDPSFAVDDITMGVNSVDVSEMEPGDALILVYPNPFSDQISIELTLKKSEDVQLEIFDITGTSHALIKNKKMDAGTFSYSMNTSGEEYASGVYFLKLQTGSNVRMKKLILAK